VPRRLIDRFAQHCHDIDADSARNKVYRLALCAADRPALASWRVVAAPAPARVGWRGTGPRRGVSIPRRAGGACRR